MVSRNQSPIAGIVAVVAIVTEHEVRAFGDDELAVVYQLLGLQEPLGSDLLGEESAIGEVVAKLVALSPIKSRVIVVLLHAVHVDVLIDETDVVAWNTNHSLYEMLLRIDRISKYDDVLVINPTIWQEPIPSPGTGVMSFVHQQVIPYEQGIFHRLRRNLEGLHNERDHEHGDDDRRRQRLQRTHPAGIGVRFLS